MRRTIATLSAALALGAAALTPAERTSYEAEWGEFCREMEIARRGRNITKGRAALLRFRQKAGLIRVDSTVSVATVSVSLLASSEPPPPQPAAASATTATTSTANLRPFMCTLLVE